MAYDYLGRLTSVTDPLGQVTCYTYYEVGNRLTQTDANGNTTKFEYDRLGRQIARILPETGPGNDRETMPCNVNGTLASHTDFAGRTRTFQYDINQRLVRRSYPNGSEDLFSFTATGQRETAIDARGVTTYTYDLRDRLLQLLATEEKVRVPGIAPARGAAPPKVRQTGGPTRFLSSAMGSKSAALARWHRGEVSSHLMPHQGRIDCLA